MISPSATTSRLRGDVRRQASPIVRAGSGSVKRKSLTLLSRTSTRLMGVTPAGSCNGKQTGSPT